LQAKSAPSACVIFTTDFAMQNLRQVRVVFLPHALDRFKRLVLLVSKTNQNVNFCLQNILETKVVH